MNQEQVMEIFWPHVIQRVKNIESGKRLVHYTSAENSYKIINNREVWLRNSQIMNDYSEIRHGTNCLVNAWKSEKGEILRKFLDEISHDLSKDIAAIFDEHEHKIREGTFIMSLSEHEDHEDLHGRLSMWRAYGGHSGVAMVLNTKAFIGTSDNLKVFSCPIFYLDVQDFLKFFADWVDRILNEKEKILDIPFEQIKHIFFHAFRLVALSIKHPGFREEQEWRVFHNPYLDGQSEWTQISIETINGVPQPIVKVKLVDDDSKGVTGIDPDKLLNRIIIGPCQFPLQIQGALFQSLYIAGVKNPIEIVHRSEIPYRR